MLKHVTRLRPLACKPASSCSTPTSTRGSCFIVLNGCPTRPSKVFSSQRRIKPSEFHLSSLFASSSSGSGVGPKSISDIVVPLKVPAQLNPDDIAVVEDIGGALTKHNIVKILNDFVCLAHLRDYCTEFGLDDRLFQQAVISFRRYCVESSPLPSELHVKFSDILHGHSRAEDLIPYFIEHAKLVFPHIECIEDLRRISDLTHPHNWYPAARSMQRKFVLHAGPTNSGKTYRAIDRLMNAKSGVYCGPLKLLAIEVYSKLLDAGLPCDLVTGELQKFHNPDGNPAPFVCCTIEMLNMQNRVEVAVIDEVQMVRDFQRGCAWTRAILGVCADEVHLCGEAAAQRIVEELIAPCGETLDMSSYGRLTPLTISSTPLISLKNVTDGDCVVCFSKQDIYTVSRQIERQGKSVAVVYGSLPPGTKLAQAAKFNDPNDPCKVMVATDAIGMGINLSIHRIIFYATSKYNLTETGEKSIEPLSVSSIKQVGGRAGRYGMMAGSESQRGIVTALTASDLEKLRQAFESDVEPIEKAGLFPTFEMIEMFAYHLPEASLSNLIDLFECICNLDNHKYFMCFLGDFKFLADMIHHVPMNLKLRYTLCLSPLNRNSPYSCAMFLRFARRMSQSEPLTLDWLCKGIGWPFSPPEKIADLVQLEDIFDVMDLYLWLGYRFPDLYPDMEMVRALQVELDSIIQEGVANIVGLLKSGETEFSTKIGLQDADRVEFASKNQKLSYARKQSMKVVGQQKTRPNAAASRHDVSAVDPTVGLGALVQKKSSRLSKRLVARGLINDSFSKAKVEKSNSGSKTRGKNK